MNHDETATCIYCGHDDGCDCVERIECTESGKIGHMSCGWCVGCRCPQFECGCRVRNLYQENSPNNTHNALKAV